VVPTDDDTYVFVEKFLDGDVLVGDNDQLRVTDSMKKATYIYSISREDYINSFFF
jgi:hypothetical protein